MARWEPDAAGRLGAAALELYVARGYEQTTVAEIAERAGVTARTFFRHFADKREVLFAGGALLETTMLAALAEAPPDLTALDAAATALDAAAVWVGRDHEHSQLRQSVLMANAELRERELIKMARLGDALTRGLVERNIDATEARVAAETAIAVFRVGFEQWVDGPATADLGQVLRDTLARFRALASDQPAAPGRSRSTRAASRPGASSR
jgi:AcrR family transcriptional regulator